MAKRVKLTPHQRETLTKLAAHPSTPGFMRWDVLKAPGPTLARLLDMQMVERGKIGPVAAWRITDRGRTSLATNAATTGRE